MSTYLQLSNKLREKCGISGSDLTAVTSLTGESKRVVGWIAEALVDIESRYTDWRWMRKGFTVNTVASDGIYASGDCTDTDTSVAIASFSHWWAHDELDPFKCYLSSGGVGGEYRLNYLPWEDFKWLYRMGTQNNSQPIHVSVDHANNLVLGPVPDAVYVVSGDFQRAAEVLAANGDTPDMPARFHMLVVYEAMKKYATYEGAGEVFADGNREASRMMRQLEADQRPSMRLSGPLA